MDAQSLSALLGMSISWSPDPTGAGLYCSASVAPTLRLRHETKVGGPAFTLLLDDVAIRAFEELPIRWVVPSLDPFDLASVSLRHRDAAERQRAVWRLQRLDDRRALPLLEQMALTDGGQVSIERGFVDDYEPIAPSAVAALHDLYGRLGLTPEDVARLTGWLHEPTEFPNGAHEVLALAGEALRPALREALTSPHPAVVIRAARTLAALREPGAGLDQLAHPDPVVRRLAIDLGEPAVWGGTWVRWPPADWRDAVLARLPIEPEAAVRSRLVAYITQYCKADPDAMLAVLGCGGDPDPGVRAVAASRLSWFAWREFGVALPPLIGAALAWARAEPDAAIRRSLLYNAPLLPHTPAVTDWLLERLGADAWQERRSAAGRLGHGVVAEVAEPLLRAATDPIPEVRWSALEALARLGERRVLPAFERELATGPLQPGQRREMEAVYRRLKDHAGS